MNLSLRIFSMFMSQFWHPGLRSHYKSGVTNPGFVRKNLLNEPIRNRD
jgi:hypothetical protein